MEEKAINKWLRRQFSGIGWVLLAYFALMNVLAVLSMVLDVLGQFLKLAAAGEFPFLVDEKALMGNAWGYILCITVGAVILHAWKGPDYWRQEVLVQEKTMTAWDFFGLLSLCVAAQLLNGLWVSLLEWVLNLFGLTALGMMESVSGAADTFSMFLYSAILAPIAEEILFRGYILRTLRPFGKRFAVLGSAFLFGMFHGNLLQTPYAFLAGLVLGYTAVEYAIVWAVVLHIFNNLVLADLMTRLTADLPEMTMNLVQLGVLGSFTLAALVILIVRRKDVAEHFRGEWIDRRCLKCFFTSAGILVLTVLMGLSMLATLSAL